MVLALMWSGLREEFGFSPFPPAEQNRRENAEKIRRRRKDNRRESTERCRLQCGQYNSVITDFAAQNENKKIIGEKNPQNRVLRVPEFVQDISRSPRSIVSFSFVFPPTK